MKLHMTAPMEMGISCRDLAKMRNFYERILGFEFVSEVVNDAGIARQLGLSDGGYTVARLQTPYGERIKLLRPDFTQPDEESTQYFLAKMNRIYLTFIVEGLESVVTRITENLDDRSRMSPIREVRPGVRAAFCKDPEDNCLEFVEFEDIATYRKDIYEKA